MRADDIAAIGIDSKGSLWVEPATTSFPFIYQAAMEVHWDAERRCLYAPKPREWSYIDRFIQIRKAALSEYGIDLGLTPRTSWSNVDEKLKADLTAPSLG